MWHVSRPSTYEAKAGSEEVVRINDRVFEKDHVHRGQREEDRFLQTNKWRISTTQGSRAPRR